MNRDQVIRYALGASVFFNFGGAALFGFPDSALGEFVGLPPDVSLIYRATVGYFVILFGAMYGWLVMQPVINRPMVALGALGKAGFFFLVALLWLIGEAPGLGVAAAVGDLAFAGVFGWWVWGGRTS